MEASKTTQPATSMAEHAQSPCVKIVVGTGDNQRTYYVQATLLKEKSGFFRGCLSHDCIETIAKEVCLAEDGPRAFGRFVGWLYQGMTGIDFADAHACFDLTHLYVLANKLICPKLMNKVMEEVLHFCGLAQAHEESIVILINAGLAQSKLTQYLVNQAAYEYVKLPESYMKGIEDANNSWQVLMAKDPKMMMDVMTAVRLASMAGAKDPAKEDAKQWYVEE